METETHDAGGESATDPRTSMRNIVHVFENGDLSQIESAISGDYLDHQGLRGVKIRGRDGFARVVVAARGAWNNLRITVEDIIVEGDKVATRLHWHGTDTTGKVIERETIEIVRFADGFAVEHWGARLWASE